MTKRVRVLALALAVGACTDPEKPVDQHVSLGGGAAARVGDDVIPLALVAKVAAAQKISAPDAARRLVDDAVAASAARQRGLDKAPPAAWLLEAARGRFTADHLLVEARGAGPLTDDEMKEVSKAHWREVDRPPSVRTANAVAQPKNKGNPTNDAHAREVAAAIRTATTGATSPEDFLARAKTVPAPDDVKVTAELLPAVTASGELSEGTGQLVEPYARAANELVKPGDVSPIVETSFGWHVIYLVERLPEQRMAIEDRRIAFASEVYSHRARVLVQALAVERQKHVKITVLPGADSIMRSVKVEPGAPAP